MHQNLTANDGIEVHDVIRAFKGDHPATYFQSGQQKWGIYLCHGCSINTNLAKTSLTYSNEKRFC